MTVDGIRLTRNWIQHRMSHPVVHLRAPPTLIDAGIKLVISGHTHRHQWMPARNGQPIAQLIGGGPALQSATVIHATANTKELRLKVLKLDGNSVAYIRLPS